LSGEQRFYDEVERLAIEAQEEAEQDMLKEYGVIREEGVTT
jgi:hypothetical protein